MKPFSDALLAMLLDFGWARPSPLKGAVGASPDDLLVQTLLGRSNRWNPELSDSSGPHKKQVDAFRRELRTGLEALRDGEEWELPRAREALVDLNRRGHNVEPRELRHFYAGSDFVILVRSAASILSQRWADIRFCADNRCGRPFVRRRRAEYCSPEHAQRARYMRWRENQDTTQSKKSTRRRGRKK